MHNHLIVEPMQATLISAAYEHEIDLSLLWSRENPAAVTMLFGCDAEARWTFARELLDGGGMGDVHVERREGRVRIALTGEDRGEGITATVVLYAFAVDAFMARARAEVPDDAISYDTDLDAFLASLDGSC